VRRPSDCLHCGDVVSELRSRSVAVVQAPHEELVVVASRGQLLFIVTPLEAADLLAMSYQLRLVVVPAADVPVEDTLVSRARAEEFGVPGYSSYSTLVARKRFYKLCLLGVPYLQDARVCSDGEMAASIRPGDTRDRIVLSQVVEFGDPTRGG